MKRRILSRLLLFLLFSVAGCSLRTGGTSEKDAAVALICGGVPAEKCLERVCADGDACPLLEALSNPVIFDFTKTYTQCEGCNTPDLPPERGIGKCIEYEVSETAAGWTVVLWVSEHCAFRYGSPSESRITVAVDAAGQQIESISPREEVLKDPLYCEMDADCRDLSGSGVPFVGCSNAFYAPLHWSGYGPGERCACEDHQCTAP